MKSHLKELQESTTKHAGEVEQYRGITEQIKKDLVETSAFFPHAGKNWITGWPPTKRPTKARRWRNPCRK